MIFWLLRLIFRIWLGKTFPWTILAALVPVLRACWYTWLYTSLCLAGNCIQIAAWAVSIVTFRRDRVVVVNEFLFRYIWSLMQIVYESLHGARITMDLSREMRDVMVDGRISPLDKSAIVISNHLSTCDFYLLHAVAARAGMLEYVKYMMKQSLMYLPGFGWGMGLAGGVFVKRNLNDDREHIRRSIDRLRGQPVWLVLYPEGHRFHWALNNQLQPLMDSSNNVLPPKSGGLTIAVQAMRDQGVRYLHDFTIAYWHPERGFGEAPSLWEVHAFGDLTGHKFHVKVDTFDISDLPVDFEGVKQWLLERFRVKDHVLEQWRQQWPST